jgi:hypothetical protein
MGGDSETAKPIDAKEVKALVSEVFEGPNANVGALPTGKTLGLYSYRVLNSDPAMLHGYCSR